jgi:hypothetical protein
MRQWIAFAWSDLHDLLFAALVFDYLEHVSTLSFIEDDERTSERECLPDFGIAHAHAEDDEIELLRTKWMLMEVLVCKIVCPDFVLFAFAFIKDDVNEILLPHEVVLRRHYELFCLFLVVHLIVDAAS